MKGLLIKDINLLKGQKQMWIGIIAIMTIVLVYADNPSFVIIYMAIIASMFTLNTMSYDEAQNGLSFLFTMPISRKNYLREKYLFGISLSVLAILAASLAGKAVCLAKHLEFPAEELLITVISGLLTAVVVLAFSLPLQVKFGMEKGRVVLLAIFGLVFLLGTAIMKLVPDSLTAIFAWADRMIETYPAASILSCCIIVLLFMYLSYLTAVHFMTKKQF